MKLWNLLNLWKNYPQGNLGFSTGERACTSNTYSKQVNMTQRCCMQKQNHDHILYVGKTQPAGLLEAEYFQAGRLEFRFLRLSALKLSVRTMRRVWTSQKFVAHSLSRPWPPLWLTSWLHCHSHISLTQNSILIFQIALISSLSLEWKWGSWVTAGDSNF